VETVELDPRVLFVAMEYFGFEKSPQQQVHIADGRVFLRRAQTKYDAILMDAYTENRYGSSLPQHLATREFFELADGHLTPNGVLAYNVIGTVGGWRSELVKAMSKTMKAVFRQVYYFPASDSLNVVLIATKSPARMDSRQLQARAAGFLANRARSLPTFRVRLAAFRGDPLPGEARAPLLTDDFAPVEGLIGKE
jgi:spermidine synthase